MYLVNTALILNKYGWEVVQARYFWISPRMRDPITFLDALYALEYRWLTYDCPK